MALAILSHTRSLEPGQVFLHETARFQVLCMCMYLRYVSSSGRKKPHSKGKEEIDKEKTCNKKRNPSKKSKMKNKMREIK